LPTGEYDLDFQMSLHRRNRSLTSQTPPAGAVLLTVSQVAENWRVSQRTIRRMIADGRLPIIRLGRAVRVPANGDKS